jgi:hypothetical protein
MAVVGTVVLSVLFLPLTCSLVGIALLYFYLTLLCPGFPRGRWDLVSIYEAMSVKIGITLVWKVVGIINYLFSQ